MKATFLVRGKEHRGEVIKRNWHTTWVRVCFVKLDIMAMHWERVVKIIKRHNIKHQVKPV